MEIHSAMGARLYIHNMYAHNIMKSKHTKCTQTYYTDHIRLLIEKANNLFFLTLHNKAEEDNRHISVYEIN